MPTKQSDYGGPRREQHGPPKIVQNPPVATVVQAFGEREGANEEGEVSVLASTRRVWRKRRGWRFEDRGDTLMMIDLSSKEGAWSFSAALAAIAVAPKATATARSGENAAEGRASCLAFGLLGRERNGSRSGKRLAEAGSEWSNVRRLGYPRVVV